MSTWISQRHHRRIAAWLPAYHAGELSETRQGIVKQHLAECATCRATVQRLATADRALSAARPESPDLPGETSAVLFQRALAASQMRPRRAAGRYAVTLGLAAAGLGLLLWLNRTLRETPLVKGSGERVAQTHLPHEPAKTSRLVPDHSSVQNAAARTEQKEKIASSLQIHRKRSPRRLATRRFSAGKQRISSLAALSRQAARLELQGPETDTQSQQMPEDRTLAGHLVVIMTGSSSPRLNVSVTTGPQGPPGFTRAAAFQSDGQGNGAWKQCTIRGDLQAETVSTTQYQFAAGQPVACLALETREIHPNDKGDRP